MEKSRLRLSTLAELAIWRVTRRRVVGADVEPVKMRALRLELADDLRVDLGERLRGEIAARDAGLVGGHEGGDAGGIESSHRGGRPGKDTHAAGMIQIPHLFDEAAIPIHEHG